MQGPKTVSESLFEDYLGRWLRWVYEPKIGNSKPDFLVEEAVVCDVTAIEADHLPRRVGAANVVQPIRNKIRDKWKQGNEAREAGLPFVLVLYQSGMQTDLSTRVIGAACFGDLSVKMEYDPTKGELRNVGEFAFGRRGATEPAGNSGLSAIAILRSFNPTLAEFDRRRSALRRDTDDAEPLDIRVAKALGRNHQLIERMTEEGTFDPEASAARLLVVHMRRPTYRLPIGFFGGLYDEEWAIDDRSGELRRVHEGRSFDCVPTATQP